jgi:ssRNA-specific RNase YbeY (16S rRNA maturation enzyme)
MGYDDSTDEERKEMRRIENIWLMRLGEETGDV